MPAFFKILKYQSKVKNTTTMVTKSPPPIDFTPAIMFQQEFKDQVQNFFEEHLNSNRIAIQICDSHIALTFQVVEWFESNYPSKFFFVISDTSFNDCCVDFISADHLKAEAIIHFGPYCSNKYDIPVCFLPDFQSKNELNGQIFFEISLFIDQIKSKNLLVITDKILASFEAFEQMCVDKELNLCFSSIENVENCDKSTKIFDFYFPLDRNDFKDTSLIYIGPHEKLALDLGCIFYNHASLCIDSKSQSIFSPSISRELAKKSGFVDAISSFDHVGILIENPNVRLYVEIAHYLQKICAANDIIADVIYVGRLNEMKIGNFPDIEFFIHLSCSGRASFSFVKPIVSPLEFLCSKFNLDFWENQYLRDYSAFIAYCDKEKKMLLPNHEDQENIDGQLVIKSFYELSTQIVSTRKNYSYNGLEINSAFQEMRLHKGATGNSTSYDYESHE